MKELRSAHERWTKDNPQPVILRFRFRLLMSTLAGLFVAAWLAPAAQAGPLCLDKKVRTRVAACAPQLTAPTGKRQRGRFGPKPFSSSQAAKLTKLHGQLCSSAPVSALSPEQRATLLYQKARIYFDAQRWPEAAIGFREVVFDHADAAVASHAGQLYLDTLNLMGSKTTPRRPSCFDDMAADVPKLLKLYCTGAKASVNDQMCKTLVRIERDIGRLEIEMLVKDADRLKAKGRTIKARKQYARAAAEYLKLWEQHGKRACMAKQPSCAGNEEILYNAARAFQAAGSRAKAMTTRKILLDPRYHLDRTGPAQMALRELGHDNQSLGSYAAAARYLERFATSAPKHEKAAEALSDVVVLRLGLGQTDKAIAAANQFLRKYGRKKPRQSAQIAFAIGVRLAEQHDWKAVDAQFKRTSRLIETHGQLNVVFGARAFWGRAKVELNQVAEAKLLFGRLRNDWQNPAAQVRKLRGADAAPAVFARRLGRALIAVAHAHHFFAEQKRAALAKNKLLAYKGPANITAFTKYLRNTLAPWQLAQLTALKAAEAEYAKIPALRPQPPPKAVVLAAAAVADMWAAHVATMRAAAGPEPAAAPAKTRAARRQQYAQRLSQIETLNRPAMIQAKQAHKLCLGYAARLQANAAGARRCEAWLSTHFPAEYNKLDELMPTPSLVNTSSRLRSSPLPDPR